MPRSAAESDRNAGVTPPVRSRLPATGTTIFTVMSALAQQHGAVNLGQGFPDFDCDPALVDAVAAAMRSGHQPARAARGPPAPSPPRAAAGARPPRVGGPPQARPGGGGRPPRGVLVWGRTAS